MKTKGVLITILVLCVQIVYSQVDTVNLPGVRITGNKIEISWRTAPEAVVTVDSFTLVRMHKGIGADEALALVPGVLVDNQHGSEKMNISVRGQGILTERGLRGINVVMDGIPLSDPTGFVPDLYDIDWDLVRSMEVYRGSMVSIYGSAASGGLVNIKTDMQTSHVFTPQGKIRFGSNGFYKVIGMAQGKTRDVSYLMSLSRTGGDGYRIHQGFRGNIFYERVKFSPSKRVVLQQLLEQSEYFQQNPEGLNLGQFDDFWQANPDAVPFNEYQKTQRTTIGLIANIETSKNSLMNITTYLRPWRYKETSNKAAEYRDVTDMCMLANYRIVVGKGIKQNINLGMAYKRQTISLYRLQSLPIPDRQDRIDEVNIESDSLLSNDYMRIANISPYLVYTMVYGRMTFMGSLRYDVLYNMLMNRMMTLDSATNRKQFNNLSYRIGLSYLASEFMTIYADISSGFTPPSAEELANNPMGYSGFNTHLVPAVSLCYEAGVKGAISNLRYEVTGFWMNSKNDFFRFKLRERGNQEVFYGNAGNSLRRGLEIFFAYSPTRSLRLTSAYTFSDFRYTGASKDPIFLDTSVVLTRPPESGQPMPNSPKHSLFAQIAVSPLPHMWMRMEYNYRSAWAIYTDPFVFEGLLDQNVFRPWYDGYSLFNMSWSYDRKIGQYKIQVELAVNNLLNRRYIAFTEPDPDGNSYHPGPGRQIFVSISLGF